MKSELVQQGTFRVKRGLLGFDYVGTEFVATCQRPFKPRGLLIWGAPKGATLRHHVIGCDCQVLFSGTPVPVKFFETAKNYEQVAKLLEQGIELPSWCDWDSCGVGSMIRLTINDRQGNPIGPEVGIELVMWGQALIE